MDPPDLAQLAICGRATGSKRFERNGKAEWGGFRYLSKRLSSSSRALRQFFQLAKESKQES
jgi:hypothetical protein